MPGPADLPTTPHAATSRSARIGAKPILWRGWLAGVAVSACLWGVIAAIVASW
jgi:hypothetical protein